MFFPSYIVDPSSVCGVGTLLATCNSTVNHYSPYWANGRARSFSEGLGQTLSYIQAFSLQCLPFVVLSTRIGPVNLSLAKMLTDVG